MLTHNALYLYKTKMLRILDQYAGVEAREDQLVTDAQLAIYPASDIRGVIRVVCYILGQLDNRLHIAQAAKLLGCCNAKLPGSDQLQDALWHLRDLGPGGHPAWCAAKAGSYLGMVLSACGKLADCADLVQDAHVLAYDVGRHSHLQGLVVVGCGD